MWFDKALQLRAASSGLLVLHNSVHAPHFELVREHLKGSGGLPLPKWPDDRAVTFGQVPEFLLALALENIIKGHLVQVMPPEPPSTKLPKWLVGHNLEHLATHACIPLDVDERVALQGGHYLIKARGRYPLPSVAEDAKVSEVWSTTLLLMTLERVFVRVAKSSIAAAFGAGSVFRIEERVVTSDEWLAHKLELPPLPHGPR